MNTHQTPKPTHSAQRLLPVVQLRERDRVIVSKDGQTIVERVGTAPDGTYGTIVKAWHSGHGKLSIVVKHDRAQHPTGLQQFELDATSKVIARSAL